MSAERHFPAIHFKTRFPSLDGIRALAVTMVFMLHYGGGSHGGPILRALNAARNYGWIGVDIFFVLSGFLITGILFDTRNDSHFFKRFYARRSLRIFPVFYLVLVILLLLTPIFHYQWHWLQLTFWVYLGNIFANYDWSATYLISRNHPNIATATFAHFWTLCVEEQFYLIWPWAIWLIQDRVRIIWTAAGVSLLALCLRIALVVHDYPNLALGSITRILPSQMDTLLIGAILALLLRGPKADIWQKRCKFAFLYSGILLLLILCLPPSSRYAITLTAGFTLIAIASAGLIGSSLRPDSPTFRLFHLRPFRTLGKYSYGFYIFHGLYASAWIYLLKYIMNRSHSLALGGLIVLPCAFIVTFFVAKLSYELFEVRFLRWKNKFQYDSEQGSQSDTSTFLSADAEGPQS